MSIRSIVPGVVTIIVLLALGACTVQRPDYPRFRQLQPRSIVVLPPTNATNSILAPELYLASVAEPLGEAGYYVFPPLTVMKYLRSQGVPGGSEAQEISAQKLREIFGADAALYANIEAWGEQYSVLAAQNQVRVHLSLRDLKSNSEIWGGTAYAVDQANNQNGVVGMLVGSLVHALLSSSSAHELELSRTANQNAIYDSNTGFLIGARRPNFAEDVRGREATNGM